MKFSTMRILTVFSLSATLIGLVASCEFRPVAPVKEDCTTVEKLVVSEPSIGVKRVTPTNTPTEMENTPTESVNTPTVEPKRLHIVATAYCPCELCCGKTDGITYTGTVATEGRTIAVDPGVIPLGSEVIIDGVTYVSEDIGGAIKGNRIDIFFDDHQTALEFGIQTVTAFVVEED